MSDKTRDKSLKCRVRKRTTDIHTQYGRPPTFMPIHSTQNAFSEYISYSNFRTDRQCTGHRNGQIKKENSRIEYTYIGIAVLRRCNWTFILIMCMLIFVSVYAFLAHSFCSIRLAFIDSHCRKRSARECSVSMCVSVCRLFVRLLCCALH